MPEQPARSPTGRRFLMVNAIVACLTVAAAILWVDACSWGIDQAVTYRQAQHLLETSEYPAYGLINSQGFRNPNMLVLMTAAVMAFVKNPLHISIALCLLQTLLMLWCYSRLLGDLCPKPSVAAYVAGIPLLVWAPGFFCNAMNPWAQSLSQTLLCVLMVLLATGPKERRKTRDVLTGMLLAALPALHLSLIVLLPVAGVVLLLARRRHSLLWLGSGAVPVFLLTWIPWLLFMVSGDPGSHPAFRKFAADRVLYGMTPFIELVKLLVSSKDILLTSLGDPSPATRLLLDTLAFFRGVFLIVLPAAIILAFRNPATREEGKRMTGAVLALLLTFSLLGFAGWAPFSGRADIGFMFIPAFLLLGVSSGVAAFSRTRYRVVPVLVVLAIAQTVLYGAVLVRSYGDVFRNGAFIAYDVPVGDKVSAIKQVVSASRGMKRATVCYSIEGFYRWYGWVRDFYAMDRQGYYVPESLVEGYAGRLAPHRLSFVDTSEYPDFIIANPKRDRRTRDLSLVNGTFRYCKLYENCYLDVWRRE